MLQAALLLATHWPAAAAWLALNLAAFLCQATQSPTVHTLLRCSVAGTPRCCLVHQPLPLSPSEQLLQLSHHPPNHPAIDTQHRNCMSTSMRS
jgi:hypothetical protein